MLKKAYLIAAACCAVSVAHAQTTFLPLGTDAYHMLDRYETMSGRLCDSICLWDRPESRRNAINFLESIKAPAVDNKPGTDATTPAPPSIKGLSNIDRYNMEQLISESGEWAPDENGAIDSKHSWFNTFYRKQYDFVYVKTKNFFLVVNPVLSGTVTMQNNTPAKDFVTGTTIPKQLVSNSHFVEIRGWIGKKLGFYTSLTDNQEQYPYHVYSMVANKRYPALPGADYFLAPSKTFGAYDYMQVSSYINFDVVKNHVNVSTGFGKHFIGDGISSLFLSDYSSSMPFLQLQARIWKLNYEALYLEMTPQFNKTLGDQILPKKYATLHYLTWNALSWLSLGFFEAEVFSRPNSYELSYINPIIFTTAINRFNGAGDKSLLGFSGKAIFAKHFQLYGQFVLNEFRAKEFFGSKGWYGNKWGVQAGAKYFNAFGIKNLDLQGEIDAVRPYTYASQDTVSNYTNYNQPLADPLGSGFIKTIGVINYQPVKNLTITAKATFYERGNDVDTLNYGNSLFNIYPTAVTKYGVNMTNGPKSHCQIMSLNLSYQIRRNVFVDLGGVYRKYSSDVNIYPNISTNGTAYGELNTNYVYFGVRINAPRRDFDFF